LLLSAVGVVACTGEGLKGDGKARESVVEGSGISGCGAEERNEGARG
jgi:hypothetical protein